MTSGFNIREELIRAGLEPMPERVHISIEEAKYWFNTVIKEVVEANGGEYNDVVGYNDIIEWLYDNKGKGLLIMGGCGLGKTIISKYVIPLIVSKLCRKTFKVVDASRIKDSKQLEDVLKHKLIVIDDMGTEELIVEYGNNINPIPIIIDQAEKQGKLLIISTNLTATQIKDRYRDRVADRLRYLCKQVGLKGESKRL